MEEDKNIKLKRRLHMISNIFSYTIIAILMIIGSFLVFYVIDGKICKSKGKINNFIQIKQKNTIFCFIYSSNFCISLEKSLFICFIGSIKV